MLTSRSHEMPKKFNRNSDASFSCYNFYFRLDRFWPILYRFIDVFRRAKRICLKRVSPRCFSALLPFGNFFSYAYFTFHCPGMFYLKQVLFFLLI